MIITSKCNDLTLSLSYVLLNMLLEVYRIINNNNSLEIS